MIYIYPIQTKSNFAKMHSAHNVLKLSQQDSRNSREHSQKSKKSNHKRQLPNVSILDAEEP